MPIYVYECKSCGNEQEAWRKVSEIGDPMACEKCKGEMGLVIPRVNINPDYQPWVDENLSGQDGTPVPVRSRRHHQQLLKERGLHIKS